jgi:hypothetical protein
VLYHVLKSFNQNNLKLLINQETVLLNDEKVGHFH